MNVELLKILVAAIPVVTSAIIKIVEAIKRLRQSDKGKKAYEERCKLPSKSRVKRRVGGVKIRVREMVH